jgi:hypothetical protein
LAGRSFDGHKAICYAAADVLRDLRLKIAVKPLFAAGERRAVMAACQSFE